MDELKRAAAIASVWHQLAKRRLRGAQSVVQRADSARDGVPFQLTPMLLTALTAAVLSTTLLAIFWYVDANPGPPPPGPPGPGGPPPPPPLSRAAFAAAVGAFGIAWVSVIVIACRDQILRRIDQIADRVANVTVEFAELREEEGVFRGMRIAAQQSPEPGGGGQVVPFPRNTPPPATPDD